MPVMSKIYQGQSFLDKVIECTGSVDNAFEMAVLNGVSITDDVMVGQELNPSTITNGLIFGLFGELNRPATMITKEQIAEIENIGIGKMIIGTNFIVT
jgi:hypothetical protein